jgi:hypothetical protein
MADALRKTGGDIVFSLKWSERQDLNLRRLGPKPRVMESNTRE